LFHKLPFPNKYLVKMGIKGATLSIFVIQINAVSIDAAWVSRAQKYRAGLSSKYLLSTRTLQVNPLVQETHAVETARELMYCAWQRIEALKQDERAIFQGEYISPIRKRL